MLNQLNRDSSLSLAHAEHGVVLEENSLFLTLLQISFQCFVVGYQGKQPIVSGVNRVLCDCIVEEFNRKNCLGQIFKGE